MNSQARVRLILTILLVAGVIGAFRLQGSAPPAAKPGADCGGCPNCQTPRMLNGTPPLGRSFVSPGPDDSTILYHVDRSTNMPPRTLHRCSQHYHCKIENFQGCRGQIPTTVGGPPICPTSLPVDSWVEIHTAFAPKLGTACNGNYESTKCCETDPNDPDAPVVVLGYHAKVTGGVEPGKVPMYWGQPARGAVQVIWGEVADEWAGSTTGPDTDQDQPPGCKPAAQWNFALGCGYTVSQRQLALFKHPEPARALQPASRLSPLARVPLSP